MNFNDIQPFLVALVIGLLLGIERERAASKDHTNIALGVRTITVLSLLGALCALIATDAMTTVIGLSVGALLVCSYIRKFLGSKYQLVGLTSEFTAITSFALGYIAYTQSQIAVIIAIIVLALLVLKEHVRSFARQRINDKEKSAAVVFLIIAFVVLPMLPDQYIDPLGLIHPTKIWLIFVFIIGIEFASYIALRLFRGRLGVALSGFLGGMVSATATALNLTNHIKNNPRAHWAILSALLLAEIASMLIQLFILIALAPTQALAISPVYIFPIIAVIIMVAILYVTKMRGERIKRVALEPGNPITIKRSAGFAITIAVVLIVVSFISHVFANDGLFLASFFGGLVSARAVVIAISGIVNASLVTTIPAMIGIAMAMMANALFKIFLISRSGNAKITLQFAIALMIMLIIAVSTCYLTSIGIFETADIFAKLQS